MELFCDMPAWFLGSFDLTVDTVCYLCSGKGWKRMVTKVCYVGEGFTRKPPKYERFIRPMVSWCSFFTDKCSNETLE